MNNSKRLYLITGMPAVGKTTFARELARHTRACLIDIDTSTEPIIQAAMAKINGDRGDRDSQLFKETFRTSIYDTLFAIADENLAHTDAIITGPFTKESSNPHWHEEILDRLKSPCIVKCVFLHCDHQLRKQRITLRANPRDAQKLKTWEQHLGYYNIDAPPAYPHFPVDTGSERSFEAALARGLLD